MTDYERERVLEARELIITAKAIARTGEPSYAVLIRIENTLGDALIELAGVTG